MAEIVGSPLAENESVAVAILESPLPEAETVELAISEREPVPGGTPSHDEIAVLAYSYWEARGYQSGSPEEDWLKAELELRSRRARQQGRAATAGGHP